MQGFFNLRKRFVEHKKNTSLYTRAYTTILREELFRPHGGSLDLVRLQREIKESNLNSNQKNHLLHAIEKQLKQNIAYAKTHV